MRGLTITHDPDRQRYEANLDGEYAGYSAYEYVDDTVIFTFTEVTPEAQGLGVANALAKHALDDIRADGIRKVLPSCPFIKNWIGKHPDYLELVPAMKHPGIA